MMPSRRFLILLVCSLLILCCCTQAAFADKTLTLTFTGDCTLGSEERLQSRDDSLVGVARLQGNDWFFANVRHLFEADDATIINLESVLSDSAGQEVKTKTYRFRGNKSLVSIMTGSSVEAANLANNHTADYGQQGIRNTRETLEAASIGWFQNRRYWVFRKNGIRIAFFGLYASAYLNNKEWCAQKMAELKKKNSVNAIVFVFHAGQEYSKYHQEAQFNFATWAVRNGADLVVMHHPHVLQGIDIMQNRYVLYSLGNFVFGGNAYVREGALQTAVVQADMRFSDDGVFLGSSLRIYPAHMSGDEKNNNYQPVLVSGKKAAEVIRIIQQDTKFPLSPYDQKLGYAPVPFLSSGADPSLTVPIQDTDDKTPDSTKKTTSSEALVQLDESLLQRTITFK